MNPPASLIPMGKSGFKRESIEYKITDMIATGKFDITDLLEEYKNCGGELDTLEKQFYIFFKALSEDFLNHNSEKALKEFSESLRLSIKNYEIGKIPEARLLTKIELLILNNIARIQYFLNQKEEAIELMEFLRSYFENGVVSEEEKAKNYPVILFNLENWYGHANMDEKVLALCEIGIDMCIHYGKLSQFPYHIFNKGCSLVKIGKIDEGKKNLRQAFTILETMKRFDDVEYGKNWLKENLNIEL